MLRHQGVQANLFVCGDQVIAGVGYSAMAGCVGAGGLGDVAIRYGYHRYQADMMLVTVVILVIIAQLIQEIFTRSSRRSDKRIR